MIPAIAKALGIEPNPGAYVLLHVPAMKPTPRVHPRRRFNDGSKISAGPMMPNHY